MKIKVFIIFSLCLLNACSSMKHTESSIAHEAKKEHPTDGSTETQLKLVEILNQDSSITAVERSQLLNLVEKGFAKNREYEVLANQKKAILVREYIKDNPDQSKISVAKSSIKKLYSKKLEEMMTVFDKMAVVMRLHPQSAEKVFTRTINGFDRF